MATKDYVHYNDSNVLAKATVPAARMAEVYVDFTESGNQLAAATDSLQLFQLPKGTIVLAAGMEQVVAGSAGNTLTARVGSVAYSGTLASDAAVGTVPAQADVSGGAPAVVTSDADFNLLSAAGIRATGVVRAWIVFLEVKKPFARPKLAPRDYTTGLA